LDSCCKTLFSGKEAFTLAKFEAEMPIMMTVKCPHNAHIMPTKCPQNALKMPSKYPQNEHKCP
jgi:hypothetical protein